MGGEARLSAWFDPTEKWLRLETSSWYMKANAILIEVGQVSISLSLSYTSPSAPRIGGAHLSTSPTCRSREVARGREGRWRSV